MEKFIQTIAQKAGSAVLRKFGKVGVKYMKSQALWDCVTEADLVSERVMLSAINKKYPAHGFISEEAGSYNPDADYVWIIDPIDGTYNFAMGVPQFGVMVGLAFRHEMVLSAIHLPATKELFFAAKGRGAYLNGMRIHRSSTKRLHNSFGSGSSSIRERTARFLLKLVAAAKAEDIQFGSMASIAVNACYTACGRRDWMVALTGALHDFAPVSLVLKEAGCKVTDMRGNPWKFGQLEMLAANPTLHRQLLKLTKRV